jgi:hypothetical protein
MIARYRALCDTGNCGHGGKGGGCWLLTGRPKGRRFGPGWPQTAPRWPPRPCSPQPAMTHCGLQGVCDGMWYNVVGGPGRSRCAGAGAASRFLSQLPLCFYITQGIQIQIPNPSNAERRSHLQSSICHWLPLRITPKGGTRRKTSRLRTTSFGPTDVFVGIICGRTRQKRSLVANGFD